MRYDEDGKKVYEKDREFRSAVEARIGKLDDKFWLYVTRLMSSHTDTTLANSEEEVKRVCPYIKDLLDWYKRRKE